MTKCKTFSSANLVLFSLLRPLGQVQIATSAKGIGNKAVAVELNLPLRQHLIEDFTKKEKRVFAAITCPTNFPTQDGNGMGLRGLLLAPNSLLMAKLHPVRGESLVHSSSTRPGSPPLPLSLALPLSLGILPDSEHQRSN